MPNIVLQCDVRTDRGVVKTHESAPTQVVSVGTNPDRYYYGTMNGLARTFEFVGVDSSGQRIYRDQTRYY